MAMTADYAFSGKVAPAAARAKVPQGMGTILEQASDDALLNLVGAGDQKACEVLMRRHLGRTLAVARRMLGNGADAEEIAQEVFLRVWTHAGRWEPGKAALSTWLHRVAMNLCLDRLRRKGMVDIDAIPEPVSEEPGPHENLERSDLARQIDVALQALPARQRAAITLVHYQGLSNIEAAGILEVTVEAVESLLARGRRQLKIALAEEASSLHIGVRSGRSE
ncbi:MAG: RNA polymerase sigma factor [Parvibaculaceae bacterium]|nr:RNA polymerase sigma factor [Parvibaculaceae bacterium]